MMPIRFMWVRFLGCARGARLSDNDLFLGVPDALDELALADEQRDGQRPEAPHEHAADDNESAAQ
jgi:hypothetical protein